MMIPFVNCKVILRFIWIPGNPFIKTPVIVQEIILTEDEWKYKTEDMIREDVRNQFNNVVDSIIETAKSQWPKKGE